MEIIRPTKDTVVYLLIDAEDTLFVEADDVSDRLTEFEQDVHFLGNPKVKRSDYIERVNTIIARYGLEEIADKIRQEPNATNPYYFCDRLCEELFVLNGYSEEQAKEIRIGIGIKVRDVREPGIVNTLKTKFPEMNIEVYTRSNAIEAEVYSRMTGLKVRSIRDSKEKVETHQVVLKSLLEDEAGKRVITVFIDDKKMIVETARDVFTVVGHFDPKVTTLTDLAVEKATLGHIAYQNENVGDSVPGHDTSRENEPKNMDPPAAVNNGANAQTEKPDLIEEDVLMDSDEVPSSND